MYISDQICEKLEIADFLNETDTGRLTAGVDRPFGEGILWHLSPPNPFLLNEIGLN